MPGHQDVFVIGDMAAFQEEDGSALPPLAPVAMQQGEYVGRLIANRLRGKLSERFRYGNKGMLAVIGRNQAVAAFGEFRVSGFPAWLLWLFVHLAYLIGFQSRLFVLLQWGFHYITRHRRTRLILERHPFCPDRKLELAGLGVVERPDQHEGTPPKRSELSNRVRARMIEEATVSDV